MGRRKNNQYNNSYNNQYNNQYNNYQNYGNNQYYNQNGQYYSNDYYNQYQYQYQQYGQNNDNNNKKEKDNKLFIYIGLFVAFAIALIIFIVVVTSKGSDTKKDDKKDEEKEPEEIGMYIDIGAEEYGYVTVPSNWIRFIDEEGVHAIQYSDVSADYIVSLDYVKTSQTSADSLSTNIYNNLKNEGVTNLQRAVVKINNYNAYQVYGYYQDDYIWLVTWVFEAEDGNTHYIGIEGPDPQSENFEIANSFKLNK